MKRTNNLTAAQIVGNLELANHALKRYVLELEEKIAKYEHVLTRCPRFRAEMQAQQFAQPEEDLYEDEWQDDSEEFDPWDNEYGYDAEDAYFDAMYELDEQASQAEVAYLDTLDALDDQAAEAEELYLNTMEAIEDQKAELEEAFREALEKQEALQDFIETYGVEALEEYEEKPEPRVITIDFEVDVDEDEDEEDVYLYAQEVLEALQDFIETYGVEALEEFEG